MRNILVFPDGTEHQFQYPVNREVEVGSKLQVQLQDDNIHLMKVTEIDKQEKAVYYKLGF